MQKHLVFISGPMGVGKSTVCEELLPRLEPAVWLDGDWCWRMSPFAPTQENRAMVLENIGDLLTRFLQNDSFGTILFSWVMDADDIVQSVLDHLPSLMYNFHDITLVCTQEELRRRFVGDPGRDPTAAEEAVARLERYISRSSVKLDVTGLTPAQTAEEVLSLLAPNHL